MPKTSGKSTTTRPHRNLGHLNSHRHQMSPSRLGVIVRLKNGKRGVDSMKSWTFSVDSRFRQLPAEPLSRFVTLDTYPFPKRRVSGRETCLPRYLGGHGMRLPEEVDLID